MAEKKCPSGDANLECGAGGAALPGSDATSHLPDIAQRKQAAADATELKQKVAAHTTKHAASTKDIDAAVLAIKTAKAGMTKACDEYKAAAAQDKSNNLLTSAKGLYAKLHEHLDAVLEAATSISWSEHFTEEKPDEYCFCLHPLKLPPLPGFVEGAPPSLGPECPTLDPPEVLTPALPYQDCVATTAAQCSEVSTAAGMSGACPSFAHASLAGLQQELVDAHALVSSWVVVMEADQNALSALIGHKGDVVKATESLAASKAELSSQAAEADKLTAALTKENDQLKERAKVLAGLCTVGSAYADLVLYTKGSCANPLLANAEQCSAKVASEKKPSAASGAATGGAAGKVTLDVNLERVEFNQARYSKDAKALALAMPQAAAPNVEDDCFMCEMFTCLATQVVRVQIDQMARESRALIEGNPLDLNRQVSRAVWNKLDSRKPQEGVMDPDAEYIRTDQWFRDVFDVKRTETSTDHHQYRSAYCKVLGLSEKEQAGQRHTCKQWFGALKKSSMEQGFLHSMLGSGCMTKYGGRDPAQQHAPTCCSYNEICQRLPPKAGGLDGGWCPKVVAHIGWTCTRNQNSLGDRESAGWRKCANTPARAQFERLISGINYGATGADGKITVGTDSAITVRKNKAETDAEKAHNGCVEQHAAAVQCHGKLVAKHNTLANELQGKQKVLESLIVQSLQLEEESKKLQLVLDRAQSNDVCTYAKATHCVCARFTGGNTNAAMRIAWQDDGKDARNYKVAHTSTIADVPPLALCAAKPAEAAVKAEAGAVGLAMMAHCLDEQQGPESSKFPRASRPNAHCPVRNSDPKMQRLFKPWKESPWDSVEEYNNPAASLRMKTLNHFSAITELSTSILGEHRKDCQSALARLSAPQKATQELDQYIAQEKDTNLKLQVLVGSTKAHIKHAIKERMLQLRAGLSECTTEWRSAFGSRVLHTMTTQVGARPARWPAEPAEGTH